MVLASARVAALFITAAASTANAQEIHFGLGRSDYDLSGTGHVFVASARYAHAVTGPLAVEVGATWFKYDVATYAFPEASLVLRPNFGSVRPFLAAGAGVTVALKGYGGGTLTLHGAGGLDLRISPSWSLRSELRLRAVDPWAAVTADITLGPTLRL